MGRQYQGLSVLSVVGWSFDESNALMGLDRTVLATGGSLGEAGEVGAFNKEFKLALAGFDDSGCDSVGGFAGLESELSKLMIEDLCPKFPLLVSWIPVRGGNLRSSWVLGFGIGCSIGNLVPCF